MLKKLKRSPALTDFNKKTTLNTFCSSEEENYECDFFIFTNKIPSPRMMNENEEKSSFKNNQYIDFYSKESEFSEQTEQTIENSMNDSCSTSMECDFLCYESHEINSFETIHSHHQQKENMEFAFDF